MISLPNKILASSHCASGSDSFFGFPTWYKYLPCGSDGDIHIQKIGDVWAIALALTEMIIYLASIAAVFMIVYGGIMFITSQGNPENTAKARKTLLNAIVGLVIAIISITLVRYIGGQFGVDIDTEGGTGV